MMSNAAYGSVSQRLIVEAFRSGFLSLIQRSILKSNVGCFSKLFPTEGKQNVKNFGQKYPGNNPNNVKDTSNRKTYVMQDFTQELKSDDTGGNATDGVHHNKVTLNAGTVYQFMQRRNVPELTSKTNEDLTQRKHWVLEAQSPTYNLDLMYKKAEKGRNTKVLEDIKLIYLKRTENIQNLMNKPEKKESLTQKMYARNPSLISKAKNFHSHATCFKKRDEELQELQAQSSPVPADVPRHPSEDPSAAAADPVVMAEEAKADMQQTDLDIPMLSVQPESAAREEVEVSSQPGLYSDIPIAQHCSHRVTHMIQHVDADTKEKAFLKKTEEIFDLQEVEGVMPVHIESVERPLAVGDSGKVKNVRIKEFDRTGKLHPESLEYTWIEVLLPKILKHIQYLDENRGEARIVSNNVTVNSLDFIKKDPRTKFSGFEQEPGTKNIDVQSQD